MNKFTIIMIIIAMVAIGIIATIGLGSDTTITEISDSIPSEVIVSENESGGTHFSASMSDTVGVTDTRP